MTEPFLILHKVRGAPAFDIATKHTCTHCLPDNDYCECIWHKSDMSEPCGMCGGEGFWWTIPTSGHRAYPYWQLELHDAISCAVGPYPDIPDDLPDHYQHSIDREASSDSSPIRSPELQQVLAGLIKPQPPLVRRKL